MHTYLDTQTTKMIFLILNQKFILMLNGKICWSDWKQHRLCDDVLQDFIKCTTINDWQGIRHTQLWSAENAYLFEAECRIYASVKLPLLVKIMACCLVGSKPLSEPMMEYCWFDHLEHISVTFNRNSHVFIQENAFEYVVCEMPAILSRSQCDIPLAYSRLCIVAIVKFVVCGFRWSIWPHSSRFLHRYWENIVFETESNYCNQR